MTVNGSFQVSRLFMIGIFVCTAAISPAAFGWAPKQAPLMTRFAKDVDPASPLPEYPRPQMVRADWLSLNGVWQYQPGVSATDTAPFGQKLSSEILVPFPVESALSGVMEHHERLWYRRMFTVPAAWAGKHVLLHFDAVDFESEPFINGKSLGIHKGGYDAFTFDVTSFLQGTGEQELVLRVFDPTDAGGQPRGKQTTHPGHITYTPTTGIWQTVWLEPVAPVSIHDLKIIPDVDASSVHITVNSSDPSAAVKVAVKDGDTVVATVDGKAGAELNIPVSNAKLWSPDSPFLYDLDITLSGADNASTDHVTSYFGMRKISLGEDHGVKKLFLNNKFVFEFGPLDQGFWPDGIYTPPTDGAIKNDIEQTKAFGFNMIRKHIKVEPARWYYWTDKLGVLVWQDMPAIDSYMGRVPKPPIEVEQFKLELQRMVEGHWNHPSIIMWVTFNESQGQHDTGPLVDMVKKLDPSRLVNEASGGTHEGFGDVLDNHNYPEPNFLKPTATEASVCGEFGGIGMQSPGHMWQNGGHGYTETSKPEDLVFLYGMYADMVKDFRDQEGQSAVVYTELTDVEGEINGLMTYDRILKVDPALIARATRFENPEAKYKPVVPTSETEAQSWQYTLTKAPADWATPGFDDKSWTAGSGPFGALDGFTAHTDWTVNNLWMRRHFNPGDLSKDDIGRLMLRDIHNQDIEVFINGVPAFNQRKPTVTYRVNIISDAAKAAIKPNADNVLAVHLAHKMLGGHFGDVGIELREP